MRLCKLTAILLLAFGTAGSAGGNLPPLPAIEGQLDLTRYAGEWFVHGSIPIRIPFFSDAAAYNYRETYELEENGSISLTCAFRDGGFDGADRKFSFTGRVTDDPSFATWKVQFVWPIRASYKVIYIDETYETTIVASANRRFAWIMSRDVGMSDAHYQELLVFLDAAGYKTEKMRRIPHNWTT